MTRKEYEEIESLRRRIDEAQDNHWRKTYNNLIERLHRLRLKQLRAEIREDRRRAA